MTTINKRRVLDWFLRYAPAEIGGILFAFLASFAVRHATHNAVASAYAAAWGETIGYAAVMLVRDLASGTHGTGHVVLGVLTEFGPAGVVDTFVTRPLAMALGVRFFGPVLGIVVGKVSADVLFYGPVIYMYEWRRRKRGRRAST